MDGDFEEIKVNGSVILEPNKEDAVKVKAAMLGSKMK